jgi:hypothetical protein
MGIRELLRWQWEGYTRYHQSRANLVLHIFVVPLFLVGNIGLIVGLARGSWITALLAVVAMVVSVVLQGRGHGKEDVPSVPFTGPANAVLRIFLEQWITFPRFVLSGSWLAALRAETPRHT